MSVVDYEDFEQSLTMLWLGTRAISISGTTGDSSLVNLQLKWSLPTHRSREQMA